MFRKTSDNEKQRLIDQHKVVYDPDHPVWGVRGIPDPVWDDVKWWQYISKEKNKKVLTAALKRCIKKDHIWCVAKLLEMRNGFARNDRFPLPVFSYLNTANYLAYNKKLAVQQTMSALIARNASDGFNPEYLAYDKMLHHQLFDALSAYHDKDFLNHETTLMFFSKLLLVSNLQTDRDRISKLRDMVHQSEVKYIPAFMNNFEGANIIKLKAIYKGAKRQLPNVMNAVARGRHPHQKEMLDVLMECGGDLQMCLESTYKELDAETIILMNALGADIYFDGGKLFHHMPRHDADIFHSLCLYKFESEAPLQPDQRRELRVADSYIADNFAKSGSANSDVKESWQKISDHKIARKIIHDDNSSIKYIFDFAARQVQVIEREPGEHPATFEMELGRAADVDLQAAMAELKKRGGMSGHKGAIKKGRAKAPPKIDAAH